MAWALLLIAVCSEVAGTIALRSAAHGSRPAIVAVIAAYGLSFLLLSLVLRRIDTSLAYAVWAGVGIALIAVIGIVHFGEPVTPLKAASLVLVTAGVVGLSLTNAH
jgi:small multidrug resistance pump